MKPVWMVSLVALCLGCLVGGLALSHAQSANDEALLTVLADDVILPALNDYVAATEALRDAVTTLHRSPSPEALTAAQTAWYVAAEAWQAPSILPLRPVMNLHSRMYKIPIKDLFIERYIAVEPVIDEAFIQGVGSTSVGLGVLEYLLFPLDGDSGALVAGFTGKRADYALATSQALASKAADLLALWQQHRADYISGAWFGGDPREAFSMTLNEVLGGLEVMAKDHLGKPLGLRVDGVPQPDEARAMRSSADIALLGAKLRGLAAFFTTEGAMGSYLSAIGASDLSEQLNAQFAQAEASWAALEGNTLSEWVVNDIAPVQAFYDDVKELVRLVKVDAANVLGITITFTDADGD